MIQVSVKLGDSSTSFRVLVRAESIERAVAFARERYPGSEVRLLLPIDPESFFVGNKGLVRAPVSLEMLEEAAG